MKRALLFLVAFLSLKQVHAGDMSNPEYVHWYNELCILEAGVHRLNILYTVSNYLKTLSEQQRKVAEAVFQNYYDPSLWLTIKERKAQFKK